MTQDNKWHNLTDNTFLLASKESVDKVIRNWLELKAKEISVFLPTKHKDDEMRKILGLSPVEEPEKYTFPNGTFTVEDNVGEWCKDIIKGSDGFYRYYEFVGSNLFVFTDGWSECPRCHTKRPEKKELWEKLIEFAESHGYKQTGDISAIHAYWMNMAKTAEAHFHDEQNEG